MNIINHEADMLGFQNVTVNLYRLLKTHQTSSMSLETKKNMWLGDKYLFELFQLSQLTQRGLFFLNHRIKNKVTKSIFFLFSLETNIETLC